jgi:plastocyanin
MKCVSRRWFGRSGLLTLALFTAASRTTANDAVCDAAVRIRTFGFHPPLLEVREGDTVIWTNDDLAPHTATARDGSWDTGQLGRGVEARITFERPGEHVYACAFHRAMTGRVLVLPRDVS